MVIVEGARAVGKTTMARSQLAAGDRFSYATLADRATRHEAATDLSGWLSRLPRPAIIDEAQLLAELPVELKEVVDRLDRGTQFVLTGSASIGRAGLGGTDPLARRSERFTMHPLTRWEINSQPGSIVDLLFDAVPAAGTYRQLGDAQLLDQLRVGGMPGLVYPRSILTKSQLARRIASDLDGLLTNDVIPGLDISAVKARAVLSALLCTPGGILNVSALSTKLGINSRTIEGYLTQFGRLFILQWLANLAVPPRKQEFARAKIHPVDTSFSVNALEHAGVGILSSRELFGQLLESHVVHEILAAAQWSGSAVRGFYWRLASTTSLEVDLVLIDARDRIVGVEVKAATRVSLGDLRGLQALAANRAGGLHRGFVLYRGDTVRQMADNIWALPLSALEDADAFTPLTTGPGGKVSEARIVGPQAGAMTPTGDAALFLSYVHADDNALHGRIVRFAQDLVARYALLYGHDLELFVDKTGIAWGESWKERLSHEIGAATFFVCAVTPRYLKSEPCRQELLEFAAATSDATRMILPLVWADIEDTDVVPAADPVLVRIQQSQYIGVQDARHLEPGSAQYDRLLEKVAQRLKQTVDARVHATQEVAGAKAPSAEADADDPDLVELMSALTEREDDIDSAVTTFSRALEDLGRAFEAEPMPPMGSRTAVAAFRGLGTRVAEPSRRLATATSELGEAWDRIQKVVERYVQIGSDSPESIRSSVLEVVEGLAASLEFPELRELEQTATVLGSLSRDLRPMSRALAGTVRLVQGIQAAAASWQARLAG